MTKDEALMLALDFIEYSEGGTADLEAHIKEALAQRTWVGLTEEERKEIWSVGEKKDQALRAALIQTIRAIEAKLKEKNT